MTPTVNFAQLGVAGIICALLLAAVVVLWRALERERKARIEDQAQVLPALTQASAAITQASNTMAEFVREAALLLRERR